MTLAQPIRDEMIRYLNGEIDLDNFEQRFAGESWDVHQKDPDATSAVFQIERVLSELSSGYGDETDLRQVLIGLLQHDWMLSAHVYSVREHSVTRVGSGVNRPLVVEHA